MAERHGLFIQHIQSFIETTDPDPSFGIREQTLYVVAGEIAVFLRIMAERIGLRMVPVEPVRIDSNPHFPIIVFDDRVYVVGVYTGRIQRVVPE